MSESKIFENWTEVDCNDCSHYWNDSCSGVKTSGNGSVKPCTAFLAARKVDIPEQIKRLRKAVRGLCGCVFLLGIAQIITSLALLFGR